MERYIVLRDYEDSKLGRVVQAKETLSMTEERAKEIETTLKAKGYETPFLMKAPKITVKPVKKAK